MPSANLIFETERLLVRDWKDADAEAAFEMYGDQEVTRFLSWTATDMDAFRERFAAMKKRNRGFGPDLGSWALLETATGHLAGTVMLKPLPDSPEVEVGYHLARPQWGKGFATEAARGCLKHGFETLGLDRVVAVVHPDNDASLRVVGRLGMRAIGRARHYEQDLEKFEMLVEEWRSTC